MRNLIFLTILLCTFPLITLGSDADTLNLQIRMTRGERGRDSSSKTTSIAITGTTVVYKVTYGGRNRGRLPEQNKEFKLMDKEIIYEPLIRKPASLPSNSTIE